MAASGSCEFRIRHPLERKQYESMLDEELVVYSRSGSTAATEYLMFKYRALVEGKARLYYLRGADHEDVVQEGMIGLYKAIRDYQGDRLAHFRAFADLCVTRQIITAVKRATRHKHDPLNSYVSLQVFDAGEDANWADRVPDDRAADPMDLILRRQVPDYVKKRLIGTLSELECQVFDNYLQGKSYREMALEMSRHTKSIDNALQRVKRKIGAELVNLQS